MDFEEILANCLDALERGETIEGCLARYPKYTAELAPLLRLATTVRSAPQPRLSVKAFGRVRMAMVAHARYQHALHKPFTIVKHKATQTKLPQRQPALRAQHGGSPLSAQKPRRFNAFGLVQRTTGVFVSLVFLLCLITLVRNISISLPSTPLYPVKILSENVQGVLLTAAGKQVAWQAQQTENRLQELIALGQQGQTADPALLKTIDADVQATLAASKNMPLAQRNQFLSDWLDHLQMLGKNQAGKNQTMPALVTLALNRALATVETATQVTIAPLTRPVPKAKSATPTPPVAVAPRLILVPTPDPAAATPMIAKAAPTEVEAVATSPALQFPTHEPGAPIVIETTPTAADVVVQIPQENPSNNAGQSNNHGRSRQSQPEPTTNTAVVAANPETANVAASGDNSSTKATSSRAITTSIDAAPNVGTVVATEATAVADVQETSTADATPSADSLGVGTVSAAPVISSTPTRALTSVGDSIHSGDTPVPVTSSSTNTPAAISTASGSNSATPTQLPGTTPVATASPSPTHKSPTPTSKKTPTPTPEKTVAPTTKPTEASPPTATPMPAATVASPDATDRTTVEPTSQSTPVPTSIATDVSRR